MASRENIRIDVATWEERTKVSVSPVRDANRAIGIAFYLSKS